MIESGIEYSCMKFHLAAMLFPVLKEEKNHTHCSYNQYMIQTVCCMFAIAVYQTKLLLECCQGLGRQLLEGTLQYIVHHDIAKQRSTVTGRKQGDNCLKQFRKSSHGNIDSHKKAGECPDDGCNITEGRCTFEKGHEKVQHGGTG